MKSETSWLNKISTLPLMTAAHIYAACTQQYRCLIVKARRDNVPKRRLTGNDKLESARTSSRKRRRKRGKFGQTSTAPSGFTNLHAWYDAATSHIKVYSFYEIDPTKLPMNAPDQLKSIRIVMVSEKSRTGVAVRFPSVNSLRLHLCDGECGKEQGAKRVPSLDEKYLLEPEVAGEVLYRRVSGDEIGENKNLWSFWVVGFSGSFDVEIHQNKKGVGWSELLDSRGMLKWGKKKKVHYLKNEEALISYDGVKGGGGEEEEEEEALKSGQLLVVEGETSELKRKLHEVNVLSNNIKKKKKTVVNKNSNSRWPKERYALAETNMWKIMKMKNAVFHKPMLRPELRAEARKLIGDTGLLDHLLKHMAGKVAPVGQDRFRRRHNADGAMEYWLESADLVNVRKQAGVQDPYWTPPPGWKPGDNPAQDPVCAAEFKQLKEDLAKIRMEMQDLFSKKQEDNLAIVATPSLNYGHDRYDFPFLVPSHIKGGITL
ncbi:hypothetical protein CUMW_218800 [Citrus unshiu]|uniref:PTC1-like winged helix-turn-helix domain-containing protein n=1 Tax=Citrus unshiu TaxID=55188 RepID=A0A2H5QDA2_CITUN|nr:hypothetical protein CUMW_218800 [Citrus unshiu]